MPAHARSVNLAVAALLVLLPASAAAQLANLQGRALSEPVGMALPGLSVAGAEEPTAVEVNPAGTGFVGSFGLQYFHQGRHDTGQGGDGFWTALPLGPVVPSLSMQWIRPEDGHGARFRKTTLGLAVSDGRVSSLGVGWNWFSSPDAALDALDSWDVGLTVRPWRHLSLGLTARDLGAHLSGRRLPIHYDAGVATRVWNDGLTLSFDLLTNDQGTNDLLVDAGVAGAAVELPLGLGLQLQVQFPVAGGRSGPAAATYAMLGLTLNAPHAGVTLAGGGGAGAEDTWLVGARLSADRYRSTMEVGGTAPRFDLADALSPEPSLLGGERDPYGALVRRIARARDDRAVPAIVVRIDDLPVGQGRIDELRQLLLDVKSRKPVVAYVVGGGLRECYLASAASLVLAAPTATLFPLGLSSTTPFLQEGLSRLGIAFDVVAIGKYKNAPDPLVRQDMSPAQREVTDRILDDLFGRQVRAIAAARGLDEAHVRSTVDAGALSAEEAHAARLVDDLLWPDEVEDALARRLGVRAHVADGWDESPRRQAQRWGPRPAVAVIRVDGTIAQGRSRHVLGAGVISGADTLVKLVHRCAEDPNVVALVVRVDSPGGDALASDLVWRALKEAQRHGKPVVVSMGDVAASGGYLIAVAADAIVAEPSTLTGSIGIFAVKPDLSGLLGKLGVNVVTVKRGAHADLASFTRRWTDAERAVVESQLRAFYAAFVSRVVEGRHLTQDRVEALAGGQVWTGAQALERGLVDRLGSLEDAVGLAKEKAGYPADAQVDVVRREPPRGLLEDLRPSLTEASDASSLAGLAARVPELRAAALLVEIGPLVALPPTWLGGVEPGSP